VEVVTGIAVGGPLVECLQSFGDLGMEIVLVTPLPHVNRSGGFASLTHLKGP